MKKLTVSSRTLLIMGIGFAMVGSAIAAGVPNTFTSGDTIKASEMNENFTALEESISTIALTPGPAGELVIEDAGIYAGQVGGTANFSLLSGAGGATEVAAADAACDVAFPGSHAELDLLVLWHAAVNSELPSPKEPAYGYWASTGTPIPVSDSMGRQLPRTTDCANWTNDGSGQTGLLRPNISIDYIYVDMFMQACSATDMAVACFIPQ